MYPNVLIPTPIHSYNRFMNDTRESYGALKPQATSTGHSSTNFLMTSPFLMENLLNSNLEKNEPGLKSEMGNGESRELSPEQEINERKSPEGFRRVRMDSESSRADSPADYRLYPNVHSYRSDSESPTDYRIKRDRILSPDKSPMRSSPLPRHTTSPIRDRPISSAEQDEEISADSSPAIGGEIDPGIDADFHQSSPTRG